MIDVADLIMGDQGEAERLFGVLKTQPEQRVLNLPVFTTLLTAHSRAEEAEVYAAAAGSGGAEDVEYRDHASRRGVGEDGPVRPA